MSESQVLGEWSGRSVSGQQNAWSTGTKSQASVEPPRGEAMSPIRPENRHHYAGETWRILREAILSRDLNQCSCVGECGLNHYAEQWRYGEMVGYICGRKNKENGVVLTIAHLCHRPACKKPSHLKSFCQRCHLRYDRFNRAHRGDR